MVVGVFKMSSAKENNKGDVLAKLDRLKNEMKAAMLKDNSVPQ